MEKEKQTTESASPSTKVEASPELSTGKDKTPASGGISKRKTGEILEQQLYLLPSIVHT